MNDTESPERQRLAASTRLRKQDGVEADDLEPHSGPEPGKGPRLSSLDEASNVAPAPAHRIDRRAELDATDVEDGALASAMGFIQATTGGTPLPEALRKRLEAELGTDLTRVRVHTDAHAAAAAAAISARAFTIGSDVYFAAGAYDPDGEQGLQLIAHEIAHVAENQRGHVDTSKKVSSPDDHHERRADEFARGFTAGQPGRIDAATDPASIVETMRARGGRQHLPFQAELEEHFGTSLDFVETYSGEAAQLACRLMEASAFVIRNVVALADPSPQRETLMHELTHVMQMGGRGAQAHGRFAPGSLSIGDEGTAAEREADRYADRPTVAADVTTIHRKKNDGKTENLKDLKDFCNQQAPSSGKPDKAKLRWGAKEGAWTTARYYAASTTAFSKEDFLAAGGTEQLLTDALGKSGVIKGCPGFRLHQASSKYVISRDLKDGNDYQAAVTKVSIEDKEKWVEWNTKVLTAATKRDIPFTWPKKGGTGAGKVTLDRSDPPTSTTELEAYRDAMRSAVAEEYKNKDGKFGAFFKAFCETTPRFTNKITGSIFEELVAASAAADGHDASPSIPVWDSKNKEQAPILKTLKKDRLDGDGVIKITGTDIAITETKAYAKMGGPSKTDEKKMRDYNLIIESAGKKGGAKFPGYVKKPGDVLPEKLIFTHAAYNIAVPNPGKNGFDNDVKTYLEKWATALGTNFNEGAVPAGKKGQPKYSAEKWSLHPPPDGSYKFKVKFNPELEYELPADQKTVNLQNPTVAVPGLKISNITANLDDNKKITSGSVTYGVDAADLKKAPETKKLTAQDEAGAGQVDNKITGLTSKLKDFLPVDIDAAIVDDGVEATIKLKPGTQIPSLAGFTVNADTTSVKATYRGGGSLEVEAEVGIKHNTKDIKGSVKVTYDGGWAFEGKVKIGDGVIPGVNELEATVSKTSSGKWKIGASTFVISKQFGAIKLTGTGSDLEYDLASGMFKGDLELDADLGMFGKAKGTASIDNNKLTKGSLSYDSPELNYPKDKPIITGTVGGTVKLDNGKFSGDIKGTADLKIAALQKIAKEGIGLSVDAHIGEDGSYSGSIKSTKPITIGKHLKIPSVGLTLEKDGSLKGDFEIEIVNIKNITNAKAKGTVDKSGVHIEKAEATVEFGNKEGKFWGSITASYTDEKGFDVSGTANYKIKDDIIATGTIKYSQETNAIGVELKVTEITLFDKKIHKDLFSASKQIPVVNIYGLGIYIDIGLDLGFDFGFKLTMTPSAKVEDFSLDTMEYKRISAKLEVGGDIYAQLTGTPKLGIGVFAIDPSIIRGGGGLKVPIVGRLDVKPKATFDVGYSPDGGADASAKLGISGEFGIKGSVKPYAEFALLNNLWNPKWEGEALAEFEILKPTELFNFTVDLNSKEKQEDPALPGKNETKTPTEPEGDQKAKAAPKDPTERGGGAGKTDAKEGAVAESGDQGPFSLDALMDKLKAIPGFATAKKIFEYGQKIWKVVKPVWELFEPLMDIIVKRIEEVIDLFDPPPSMDNIGDFLWKLAKLLFNLSFGGLTEIASAIKSLLGKAASFAKKLINKAVQDGHIGVKRHSYYIWMPWPKDDIEFMAAAEWKINIPGVANLGQHGPPGFLLTPSGAVSLVLYEALQAVGIGYTYVGNSDINKPYNDIWAGAGARG